MDNLAYVWDAVRLQARYALLGHTAEVTQVFHLSHSDCDICNAGASAACNSLGKQ